LPSDFRHENVPIEKVENGAEPYFIRTHVKGKKWEMDDRHSGRTEGYVALSLTGEENHRIFPGSEESPQMTRGYARQGALLHRKVEGIRARGPILESRDAGLL